jgi:hypothetical protein
MKPAEQAADQAFQTVGVAGFEPTASSSRTAGSVVDRGYFRTSMGAGGHPGAVLASLVAVFRGCTADVVRPVQTSYFDLKRSAC